MSVSGIDKNLQSFSRVDINEGELRGRDRVQIDQVVSRTGVDIDPPQAAGLDAREGSFQDAIGEHLNLTRTSGVCPHLDAVVAVGNDDELVVRYQRRDRQIGPLLKKFRRRRNSRSVLPTPRQLKLLLEMIEPGDLHPELPSLVRSPQQELQAVPSPFCRHPLSVI